MEKYRLVQESKVDLMMSGNEEFSATGNTTTTSHHSGGSVVGTGVNNCGWPEVRITQQGKNRNYISYALNLFVRIYLLTFCLLATMKKQSNKQTIRSPNSNCRIFANTC